MQQVHDVPSVVPGTPRSRTATIPARAFLQASRDEKCRDRHGANAGKESRTAGRCYAGKGIADCGAQGQAETMLGAEPIHLEDRVSDGGVEERRVTLRAYQAARGGGFDQRNTTRNTFHSRERLHAGKGHPTVEPCQPAESMLPLSKGPSTRHQSPRLRPSTRFALFQWCLTDHAGRESPSEFVSRCHPWGQRCFT